MTEVILKSKRKVKVKELTLDQIADLQDIPEIKFDNGVVSTIKNLNKAKLAWLRCGIGGGDFTDWEPNGVAPPDAVLKQLSGDEQDELIDQIKAAQELTEKKP